MYPLSHAMRSPSANRVPHPRALTRSILVFFLLLAVFRPPLPAAGAEVPEPFASIPGRLQPRAAEFPPVTADTAADTATVTTVILNQKTEIFATGHAFDAIRIRAPKQPGLDLIWAFSTPPDWRHWYIIPADGEPKPGFRNWINGDRAYAGFDGDLQNPVTLQSLGADYFEPDREYLIWFCQTKHTPEPAVLKLTLRFAPPPAGGKWDIKSIEEALKLQSAPVAAQAGYFNSRGARILRDTELFHPDDAAGQMDHFLFTRRQTEFLKGGYYITIESSCPPCHGSPLLGDIVRKHGAPDCTLSVRDQNAIRADDSGEPARYDRHYFDFFVFETDPADARQRVVRVSSQYFNLADANPAKKTGGTWTDVKLLGADVRFFYRDGREVVRYVGWHSPESRLVSGEPRAAEYTTAYPDGAPMEKLVCTGKTDWTYESYYRSGPVYRTCSYVDGKPDGVLTDYFESGAKRAEVHYRHGKPHGRLRVWTEEGALERDQSYVDGRPEEQNR